MNLNEMIQAALLEGRSRSMEKIAQETSPPKACKVCGKPAVAGSDLCKECADKEAAKEQASVETEKTSSERIEKLAAAVEYITNNFATIDKPVGQVKSAQGAETQKVGPGKGPNTLALNDQLPTSELSDDHGQAKQSPPTNPPQGSGSTPKSAPNAMQTNETIPAAPYPETGVMKAGSLVDHIKKAMLRKAGQDDGENANVSAPKTQTLTTPEDQPSQAVRPAETTSQEKMISSNEAAMSFTKRDAKAVPKKQLAEVLKEPAQSRSTDKALDQVLGKDVVNRAGAKIAAARQLLQKVASEGCSCEKENLMKGACGHCKLANTVRQREEEKVGSIFDPGVTEQGPGSRLVL